MVLASGNGDGTVRLWDTGTMTSKVTLHFSHYSNSLLTPSSLKAHQRVYSVAFSRDGKVVAAIHGDGTIGLWHAASGKNITFLASLPVGSVGYQLSNGSVAFDPTGAYLATSYDASTVELRDPVTGQVSTTLGSTGGAWINSLAFSSDGTLLATGSAASPRASGSVNLWNIPPDGTTPQTLAHANTGFGALASANDQLASVNSDGTVSLWNLASGTGVGNFSNPKSSGKSNAQSIAFKSDGSQLLSGNADGTVTIWDRASQQITGTLNTSTDTAVNSVAFSPSATKPGLACGGTNLVLWTS
jgi:WD40 repeat protein